MASVVLVRRRRWQWLGISSSGFVMVVMAGGLLPGLAGCGGQSGVARYDFSGTVLYDGKPVPSGYLQFAPDRKQGNRGPGTSATIKDGHYQTVAKLGIVGGPHVVTITGTDGVPYKTQGVLIPIGRPLFPEYEVRVDFPKESGTYDFEVPVPKGRGK